jgi:pimeloyl-ACP methyl ester carboxylesterase
MALVAGVAGLLVAPYVFVVVSLIVASVWGRGVDNRVSRPADWLRVGLTEPVQFCRALVAMMSVGRSRQTGFEQPIAGCPSPPVLLIHGIVCNRAIWRGWIEPLRAAGFSCVRAVDLEPIFADLDRYAADVVSELREMQRRSGGARVAIIAHSMGGLVARAALRITGPGVISSIVTIGSPHHGTAWARLAPFQPTRQMRPGSSWLHALNASQEGSWQVPLTSIYSMQDEFIVPPRSAMTAGAQNHELRGFGHLGIIASPECMTLTLAALGRT